MLLAPEPGPNGKLHLFPSWPKDWDVDFKLHAPGQTVVEGVLKGGKLESLKVTPESRAKDIVNWLGKETPYVPPVPGDTGFEPPKPAATPLPDGIEPIQQIRPRKNSSTQSNFHISWGAEPLKNFQGRNPMNSEFRNRKRIEP